MLKQLPKQQVKSTRNERRFWDQSDPLVHAKLKFFHTSFWKFIPDKSIWHCLKQILIWNKHVALTNNRLTHFLAFLHLRDCPKTSYFYWQVNLQLSYSLSILTWPRLFEYYLKPGLVFHSDQGAKLHHVDWNVYDEKYLQIANYSTTIRRK